MIPQMGDQRQILASKKPTIKNVLVCVCVCVFIYTYTNSMVHGVQIKCFILIILPLLYMNDFDHLSACYLLSLQDFYKKPSHLK